MSIIGHHGLLLKPSTDILGYYAANLYTGNGGSTRAIPGVDLSGGGISMFRNRTTSSVTSLLFSVSGGAPTVLALSGTTAPAAAAATFSGSGTSLTDATFNTNAANFVNWTIKKMAGVLDIVTYTGNGANRTIAHSLGVTPGMIWIIPLAAANKYVYLQSLGNGAAASLSQVGLQTNANIWNSTSPTSAVFSLGTSTLVNNSGTSYVAIVFAGNSTGVFNQSSYVGNGSATGPTVSPGWEAGLIWNMHTTTSDSHQLVDQARTPGFTGMDERITTSSSSAVDASANILDLVAGGWQMKSSTIWNANAVTYHMFAIKKP